MSKILMPRYVFEFPTTAARLLYAFDANDRGSTVFDLENGRMYVVAAGGTGAGVMVPLAEQYGTILLRLRDFHEVDANGDVGNLADTGGGQLAGDSTPIYRGDAAESGEIVWAASNNDIIALSTSLPDDIDDTRDFYVDLTVASGGTANAASFTVETGWDGGALVSDTATGAAATADQDITATVAAADVPASPKRLTLMLTPTAHTTDTKILKRARLRYFRK